MDNHQIQMHIINKELDKKELMSLLEKVKQLDNLVGLRTDTMMDITAKISSKVNQCDRSIRDHEKLLNK